VAGSVLLGAVRVILRGPDRPIHAVS